MSYSPIALFVYNREDHFIKTYKALSECRQASKSELFIFSDGAKNLKNEDAVEAVRKAADDIVNDGKFKSVTVIKSPENKGLARSIIEGVTELLNKFGTIIVLEDDCVASPYLLTYMNKCLKFFNDDKTVGSVAGYTPPINIDEYQNDIFLAKRSCSWGWATWRDRWDNVDWEMKFMKSFYDDYSLVKDLNSNGNDRFMRLYRQSKKNTQSWSIRFGAHHVINNYSVVYPKYSYIRNVGCDATGVHSKAEDAELIKVNLDKAIEEPEIGKVNFDKKIQKKLYRFYSGNFISRTRRSFATKLIVTKESLTNK